MMKRIHTCLGIKLMILLALGCLPYQKTAAMSACAQETWSAANHLRDTLGYVGQCIAGYTLYETSKKVGMRGVMSMLASKEYRPFTCIFIGSCLVEYVIGRSSDYNTGMWFHDEAIPLNYFKGFSAKQRCKYVSCVAARWLWVASVLYFLKVAQPLSASAPTSRMFA